MSLPTAFFLDTSIFDGQHYNFQSTAISSFIPVAKKHGLICLLPDITEKEVRRHIDDRISEVIRAFENIHKRASFLSTSKYYPPNTSSFLSKWEMGEIARNVWESFLNEFKVQKVGYVDVDLKNVMSWYENVTAPFGEGGKRKEFPDAFVISMLEQYAKKNNCVIAVVSSDNDFKFACERFSSFLYFSSLPQLTELLLTDSSEIDKFRESISNDMSLIEAFLFDDAGVIDFGHYDSKYSIKESHIHSVEVTEIFIVALGINECTITFSAELEAEHLMKWVEYFYRGDEFDELEEWVYEVSLISGIAKIAFDPATNKLSDIKFIESDIFKLEIEADPRQSR